MRKISRRFGTVLANEAIDLELHEGEIHALLGENGAGKSTLMHILSGSLRPDNGDIELAGSVVRFGDPRAALQAGIGMVHQHFQVVPTLSVAANVLLNDEPVSHGLLDQRKARDRVSAIAASFGMSVDPDAIVRDTTVATQQKVEILKVLHREVRVLILDEPTAVLTPQEVRDLFRFLRQLAGAATSVVLITHKLTEALSIADRLTVLRGGRVVFSSTPAGLTPSALAKMMVGREVLLKVQKAERPAGPAVMQLQQVRALDDRGLETLKGIDLECRAGEIVGIAGVDGNGQRELVEVMTGLRPITGGTIKWLGRQTAIGSAANHIRRGIAYIPEDRQRRGLIMELPVSDNLILRTYRDSPFSRHLRLQRNVIAQYATRLLDAYRIRTSHRNAVRKLSGGNQQKLVVGRELSGSPRLLIAAQPTRGVDVGATQFVYDELIAQRDADRGILLVSFDLDELLSLSDRIAVIFEGRIVAQLQASEANEEVLGTYMTGARRSGQIA